MVQRRTAEDSGPQAKYPGTGFQLPVGQMLDGDEVDVWVCDRYGLDGRTEPCHWAQISQVRSLRAAQPDLAVVAGASVAGGPGIQEQVEFLRRPIGSEDDLADLPAGVVFVWIEVGRD